MSTEVPETEPAEEKDLDGPDTDHCSPVPPTKEEPERPVKADEEKTIGKPDNNYSP